MCRRGGVGRLGTFEGRSENARIDGDMRSRVAWSVSDQAIGRVTCDVLDHDDVVERGALGDEPSWRWNAAGVVSSSATGSRVVDPAHEICGCDVRPRPGARVGRQDRRHGVPEPLRYGLRIDTAVDHRRRGLVSK